MDVAAPLKNISISIHQYDLTVSFHKNPFEFLKIQNLFSPYLSSLCQAIPKCVICDLV